MHAGRVSRGGERRGLLAGLPHHHDLSGRGTRGHSRTLLHDPVGGLWGSLPLPEAHDWQHYFLLRSATLTSRIRGSRSGVRIIRPPDRKNSYSPVDNRLVLPAGKENIARYVRVIWGRGGGVSDNQNDPSVTDQQAGEFFSTSSSEIEAKPRFPSWISKSEAKSLELRKRNPF